MNTSLCLLTGEGAVVVIFSSVLTPTQYARLYDRVQDAVTKSEMESCILEVAEECGLEVVLEDNPSAVVIRHRM